MKARIEKNKDQDLWGKLKTQWRALIAEEQAVIDRWRNGNPMPSFKRIAAIELVKLSNAVEPEEVVETVLGMYLLQDQEPRKIKGHTAFLTQMVRRVRGLTTLNASIYPKGDTGKVRTAYRELSPKAVEVMGMKLAMAFGAAGLALARLERKDHEKRLRELTEFKQALGGLQ